MSKIKRRFAGSYYMEQNSNINIESMGQFTSEMDVDSDGNRWVASVVGEDASARFKTKAEAIEYASDTLLSMYPTAKY